MISGNVLLVLSFDIQCHWKKKYRLPFYKVAFGITLDIYSSSWLHLVWQKILPIQWKHFLMVKLLSGGFHGADAVLTLGTFYACSAVCISIYTTFRSCPVAKAFLLRGKKITQILANIHWI